MAFNPLADIDVGNGHTKSDDFDERFVVTLTEFWARERTRYKRFALRNGLSTLDPTALNRFFT